MDLARSEETHTCACYRAMDVRLLIQQVLQPLLIESGALCRSGSTLDRVRWRRLIHSQSLLHMSPRSDPKPCDHWILYLDLDDSLGMA